MTEKQQIEKLLKQIERQPSAELKFKTLIQIVRMIIKLL